MSTRSITKPKKTKVKVVNGNVVDSGEVINQISSTKRKNQAKTAKFKNLVKPKNHDFSPNFRNLEARPGFYTSEARLAFTMLKQVFVKSPIFHYFNLKCHIRIESDVSRYVIAGILSQLTLDDLDQ